jgi:GT2 family glycosyltransferase
VSVSAANLGIVVVTYRRNELLTTLFDSFIALNTRPRLIVVVDNDANPDTRVLCEELHATLKPDDVDVRYIAMDTNTGGAGGFSRGAAEAYDAGAEWLWLMDDDVKLLPHAVDAVEPWLERAVANNNRVLQVRRLNFNGEVFYWQYHFINSLGIPNPVAKAAFADDETSRPMNTACFEGGLFHRSVVAEIGLPDPRFFIYWDDTTYGYLASKVTKPLLISDIVMQRTREISHARIGEARKLNGTSDMVRYHIMRNRGYISKYLAVYGDYHPVLFGIGTAATAAKELIRIALVDREASGLSGVKAVFKGMRDAWKIYRDWAWQPMPPLASPQA